MAKYVPVAFDLIDEGRFKAEVDRTFNALQAALIEFVRKHGEKAKDAKAGLTLQITLKREDQGAGVFSIRADIRESRPMLPPSVTLAVENERENGELALFVRASGSGKDTPLQGVLATEDGRTVNPATGEVVTGKAAKKEKA